MENKTQKIISWVCQIIAAIILSQTLFFKFTGAPESIALFTKLGVESWGRIGSGVMELIAVILLLIPRTSVLGALLGVAIMLGAIFSHLTVLGILWAGDATLFILAVVTLICCLIVVTLRRQQIPIIGNRF